MDERLIAASVTLLVSATYLINTLNRLAALGIKHIEEDQVKRQAYTESMKTGKK